MSARVDSGKQKLLKVFTTQGMKQRGLISQRVDELPRHCGKPPGPPPPTPQPPEVVDLPGGDMEGRI